MIKTVIKHYVNKRNDHKHLEVHEDGYGHFMLRQYMKWDNGVIVRLGDRYLHRWKRKELDNLLEDYSLEV